MSHRTSIVVVWGLIVFLVAQPFVILLLAPTDADDVRSTVTVMSLLAAAVLASVAASGGRMVNVTVDATTVTIRPRGLHRFWALSRGIEVPRRSILGVTTTSLAELEPPLGMKWPGTALPGLYFAGSYGWGKARTFVLTRRGREVVVLRLAENPSGYRRVVLEDAAAADLLKPEVGSGVVGA